MHANGEGKWLVDKYTCWGSWISVASSHRHACLVICRCSGCLEMRFMACSCSAPWWCGVQVPGTGNGLTNNSSVEAGWGDVSLSWWLGRSMGRRRLARHRSRPLFVRFSHSFVQRTQLSTSEQGRLGQQLGWLTCGEQGDCLYSHSCTLTNRSLGNAPVVALLDCRYLVGFFSFHKSNFSAAGLYCVQ